MTIARRHRRAETRNGRRRVFRRDAAFLRHSKRSSLGGEVRDYADLLRLGNVAHARVTQVMNLLTSRARFPGAGVAVAVAGGRCAKWQPERRHSASCGTALPTLTRRVVTRGETIHKARLRVSRSDQSARIASHSTAICSGLGRNADLIMTCCIHKSSRRSVAVARSDSDRQPNPPRTFGQAECRSIPTSPAKHRKN